MRNPFFTKCVHQGNVCTHVLIIIPYVLYISGSIVRNHKGHESCLHAIHVTPFLAFGIHWGRS